MSRIGQKPINIPEGVVVEARGGEIKIKGAKGDLVLLVRPEIRVIVKEKQILLERDAEDKFSRSLHGLLRTLIANAIIGVNRGWSKTLKLLGTGYRVELEGEDLVFHLGFSHPVKILPKSGVKFTVEGNDTVFVSGVDKVLVGQVAAKIRDIKPPEPYKGKGIRYQDEVVRRKPGKAAKVGAAGSTISGAK